MLGVGARAAYRSHRDTIDPEYSEMTTNILVTFYSTYGHVHRMALAVAEGAESVPDSTVRLRRIAELEEARKALSAQNAYVRAQQPQAGIPEVTHDDLRWADGIAWGTPTRYGNMTAQMKQFIDTTGGLWLKGELEDKATGIFTSTSTIHGGQETRILTALVPLIHLGMVFVGTPLQAAIAGLRQQVPCRYQRNDA